VIQFSLPPQKLHPGFSDVLWLWYPEDKNTRDKISDALFDRFLSGRIDSGGVALVPSRDDLDAAHSADRVRTGERLPTWWWEKHGRQCPELKRFALRLLSQPCSSSTTERIFSTHGNIQTVKRTRIKLERLESLVFASTYLRRKALGLSCTGEERGAKQMQLLQDPQTAWIIDEDEDVRGKEAATAPEEEDGSPDLGEFLDRIERATNSDDPVQGAELDGSAAGPSTLWQEEMEDEDLVEGMPLTLSQEMRQKQELSTRYQEWETGQERELLASLEDARVKRVTRNSGKGKAT
jgi:hypothetical protein